MEHDKLSRDQRIRLEALAQSIAIDAANAMRGLSPSAIETVRRARAYERFIRGLPDNEESHS